MADYAETLFQAVDILLNKKIEQIKFDQTIKATVIDTSKADIGEYLVSTGEAKFIAYSTETKYRENETVMVTIPQGDYNNQKIIISEYVDNSNTPITVQTPFDSIIDLTNNIITTSEIEEEIGIWANDYTQNDAGADNAVVHRGYEWEIDQSEFKRGTGYQQDEYWWEYPSNGSPFQGYQLLGLRAQFSTWLAEYGTYQGNYGLGIELIFEASSYNYELQDLTSETFEANKYYYKENNSDDWKLAETFQTNTNYYIRTIVPETSVTFTFDSDEFFGNVYAFETYYTQEAVFDLTDYADYPIKSIRLFPYQRQNFKGSEGDIEASGDGTDFNNISPNIFIKDPYICFGQFASTFKDDTAELMCENLVYQKTQVENENREDNNLKTINLRWVHKDDNTGQIAVVEEQTDGDRTVPDGYEIRWYYHKTGAQSPDAFAGAHWERFYGKSFVVDEDTGSWLRQESLTIENISDFRSKILKYYNEGQLDYNDYTYLFTQSYLNINKMIEYWNGDIATNHTIIEFQPNVNNQTEQLKVIIVKNVNGILKKVAESNILEFTNRDEIRNQATLIDLNALSIKYVDDKEGLTPAELIGTYFLYDEANHVVNDASSQVRFLQGVYDPNTYNVYEKSNLSNSNPTMMKWTFPASNQNSMIQPMEYDATNNKYVDKKASDSASYVIITDTDNVPFRIKENLNREAKNNTVILETIIDGQNYIAETEMLFGTAGTSGSDYTIQINWVNNEDVIDVSPDVLSETAVTAISARKTITGYPVLYDQFGHIVDLEDSSATWEVDWFIHENTGNDIELKKAYQKQGTYFYYPIYYTENDIPFSLQEDIYTLTSDVSPVENKIYYDSNYQEVNPIADTVNPSDSGYYEKIDNKYYYYLWSDLMQNGINYDNLYIYNNQNFEKYIPSNTASFEVDISDILTNISRYENHEIDSDNEDYVKEEDKILYYYKTKNEKYQLKFEPMSVYSDILENDELNMDVSLSNETFFSSGSKELSREDFINNLKYTDEGNNTVLVSSVFSSSNALNNFNNNNFSFFSTTSNSSLSSTITIKKEENGEWENFVINNNTIKWDNLYDYYSITASYDNVIVKNANTLNLINSNSLNQEDYYKELFRIINGEEPNAISVKKENIINQLKSTTEILANYTIDFEKPVFLTINTIASNEYIQFITTATTVQDFRNYIMNYNDKYNFYKGEQLDSTTITAVQTEISNGLIQSENNNYTLKERLFREVDYNLKTYNEIKSSTPSVIYSIRSSKNYINIFDSIVSTDDIENDVLKRYLSIFDNNYSSDTAIYKTVAHSQSKLNEFLDTFFSTSEIAAISSVTAYYPQIQNNVTATNNEIYKYFLNDLFNSNLTETEQADCIGDLLHPFDKDTGQYYYTNKKTPYFFKTLNEILLTSVTSTQLLMKTSSEKYEYTDMLYNIQAQLKRVPQILAYRFQKDIYPLTNEQKYEINKNIYNILNSIVISLENNTYSLEEEPNEQLLLEDLAEALYGDKLSKTYNWLNNINTTTSSDAEFILPYFRVLCTPYYYGISPTTIDGLSAVSATNVFNFLSSDYLDMDIVTSSQAYLETIPSASNTTYYLSTCSTYEIDSIDDLPNDMIEFSINSNLLQENKTIIDAILCFHNYKQYLSNNNTIYDDIFKQYSEEQVFKTLYEVTINDDENQTKKITKHSFILNNDSIKLICNNPNDYVLVNYSKITGINNGESNSPPMLFYQSIFQKIMKNPYPSNFYANVIKLKLLTNDSLLSRAGDVLSTEYNIETFGNISSSDILLWKNSNSRQLNSINKELSTYKRTNSNGFYISTDIHNFILSLASVNIENNKLTLEYNFTRGLKNNALAYTKLIEFLFDSEQYEIINLEQEQYEDVIYEYTSNTTKYITATTSSTTYSNVSGEPCDKTYFIENKNNKIIQNIDIKMAAFSSSENAFWNSNNLVFTNDPYDEQIDLNNQSYFIDLLGTNCTTTNHIIRLFIDKLNNLSIARGYQLSETNILKRKDILKPIIYNLFIDYYNNYKVYLEKTGNNKEEFYNYLSNLCFNSPLNPQIYINSYINNHYNNETEYDNFKKLQYENKITDYNEKYIELFPSTELTYSIWLDEVKNSMNKSFLGFNENYIYNITNNESINNIAVVDQDLNSYKIEILDFQDINTYYLLLYEDLYKIDITKDILETTNKIKFYDENSSLHEITFTDLDSYESILFKDKNNLNILLGQYKIAKSIKNSIQENENYYYQINNNSNNIKELLLLFDYKYFSDLLDIFYNDNVKFYLNSQNGTRYFNYNSGKKAFIKENDYYILDYKTEYNSTTVYYKPELASEKEISDSGLLSCAFSEDNTITISPINNVTTNNLLNSLNILRVTLNNFGDYDLVANFPIAMRSGTIIQNNQVTSQYRSINGPTIVWYPTNGTPEYNQNPYQIIYQTTTGTTTISNAATWSVFYKKEYDNQNNEIIDNFLPSIATNVPILKPISVYIDGAKNYGVQCIVNNEIVWSQPIYVYSNKYFSQTINKWNGTGVQIDEEKGIILSQAFAAGKKEDDNTFSGVMLGDWSVDVAEPQLSKQTGIYGFSHGEMSYAFKEDGTAFIGKNTGGRIYFDGDKGQITSNNWKGNEPLGLLIDIDDGYIQMRGKASDETRGYIDLNSNPNVKYPLSIGTESYNSRRGFKVAWNGDTYIGNGEFNGKINAKEGSISGKLEVTGTLSGGTILADHLEAYQGNIGGWTINQSSLLAEDGDTILHAQNGITTNSLEIRTSGLGTIGKIGFLIGNDSITDTKLIGISSTGKASGIALQSNGNIRLSGNGSGNKAKAIFLQSQEITITAPAEKQIGIYARFA